MLPQMTKPKDMDGEPLKGSGFENEPVTNDDGVTYINGEPVIVSEQPGNEPVAPVQPCSSEDSHRQRFFTLRDRLSLHRRDRGGSLYLAWGAGLALSVITKSVMGATDADDGLVIPRARNAATRADKCTANGLSWIAQRNSTFRLHCTEP